MSLPELKYEETFFSEEAQPPVIPVIFQMHHRLGNKTRIFSKIGWEGWEVAKKGKGFTCSVPEKFTLKCLSDGYAEIPATKKNVEKIKRAMKPTKSLPTYDRGIRKRGGLSEDTPHPYEFKNKKKIWQILDQKALEEGEIRMIDEGSENLPEIKTRLKKLKEFDVKTRDAKRRDIEAIRPWLLPFISVPAAVMESNPI